MKEPSDFWNALAPFHSALENNYFDLPSLRRILPELREPVLVVGAGQGLIVAEVLKSGLRCDGVDFSSEMIRYAGLRRGLSLIQADAKAMPLKDGAYQTIIYATGVVDFIGDEAEIKLILDEAARVVSPTGKIFVAFYRASAAVEDFLTELGLLHNHILLQREALEMNRLKSFQLLRWVAKKADVSYLRAALLLIRMSLFSSLREKMTGLKMQKIFRKMNDASSLIENAPEKVPYRNEAEIRNLFERLRVPMKQLTVLPSCIVARIQPNCHSVATFG
jgi:ubiquinone/menaquinone biosynthesis C-methylase UbiE